MGTNKAQSSTETTLSFLTTGDSFLNATGRCCTHQSSLQLWTAGMELSSDRQFMLLNLRPPSVVETPLTAGLLWRVANSTVWWSLGQMYKLCGAGSKSVAINATRDAELKLRRSQRITMAWHMVGSPNPQE